MIYLVKMEIYQPEEDSYFLAEISIKEIKNKNMSVLDLGTGSGIQSKNLIDFGIKKENILAVDLNQNSLKQVKNFGIKTKKSNLFSSIKNQKFDLILFNPPYLPEDNYDKEIDTTGGEKGDEIIVRFIAELNKHLTKNGFALLLTSSLTPEKYWKKIAKTKNLKVKKVAKKRLFFEYLYIWRITLQ